MQYRAVQEVRCEASVQENPLDSGAGVEESPNIIQFRFKNVLIQTALPFAGSNHVPEGDAALCKEPYLFVPAHRH